LAGLVPTPALLLLEQVCTSLLWLQRALRLVETMLAEYVRGAPLKEAVSIAYGQTLKCHHNVFMRWPEQRPILRLATA